ncbi:hypothetical protein D3H65_18845 [Paraflavitalea soli]|uniref:Stationary phase survival protein SurE n=1 Tax=Paraflavitalea soli TaxID=2315862 RepID=A0A3B7MN68_9BACT|nr:hypothetical protein [Paraflavitalea soli]AXY75912.1 hypothetical protein D3H65_18845 [Paraflavitalea soli]
MFKKDNLRFGMLIGFIAPLLSLVIYYFVKFYPLYSVSDFFRFVAQNKNQVTAISVPCLILNIALFTFYINTHRDKTAKGVFAITLIYAIGALLLKFAL